MIIEDDFFPDPKENPPAVTVAEICERFTAAGLPCKCERQQGEVRIAFQGRKSSLVFTVNPSGYALTATLPEDTDYDADFACVIFQVFESVGWTYAPGQD